MLKSSTYPYYTSTYKDLHLFNTPHSFGFNGMEIDNEFRGQGNSYDFGARIHDPRLGRFFSVDPEFQKYPSQSSYCFSANSPIRFIDSEGKGVLDKIVALFSRSYNFVTKGSYKTNYEIQKEVYKNALHARYDYYNMVVEADPTKANNDYLLSIPFLVDKFDATNPDKDKLSEWKPDIFDKTETYLASPSSNFGQKTDKIAGNMLYGVVNSPYILLFGESLAGESQTPKEKMDAFIDVAPSKLLGGVNAKSILKLKGGYEDFAKQTKGMFEGSSTEIFKQRMKAYRVNQQGAAATKAAENADKVRGAGTETKKELEKQ